jgi:chemotaxis protein MotB
MISYADFITLLMIFFVVLYAMSKVDQKKYDQLSQSLNVSMGGGGGTGFLIGTSMPIDLTGSRLPATEDPGDEPTSSSSPDVEIELTETETLQMIEARQLADIEKNLRNYFAQQNIENSVQIQVDERGLVVALKDVILFDPGRAEIKSNMVDRLVQIGKTINVLNNYIRIEGHTDNTPINTPTFRSNWELSVLRATTVQRLFTDMAGVPPQKLSAVGYGEYRPIANNATTESRALNRRVNIIILSSRFDDLERSQSEAR